MTMALHLPFDHVAKCLLEVLIGTQQMVSSPLQITAVYYTNQLIMPFAIVCDPERLRDYFSQFGKVDRLHEYLY